MHSADRTSTWPGWVLARVAADCGGGMRRGAADKRDPFRRPLSMADAEQKLSGPDHDLFEAEHMMECLGAVHGVQAV